MSDRVEELFERVAALEEKVRAGSNAVDAGFADARELAYHLDEKMDRRFGQIDERFDQVDSRFNRLERKLDQFIDTQSKTNELTERRLIRLENA